ASRRFDIGGQRAGVISNVAGDQINNQNLNLRFAPLRRRARALLRTGVALLLASVGLELVGFVRYASAFLDWIHALFNAGADTDPGSLEPAFTGMLTAILPFTIAAGVLLLAGLACIAAGLSVRRRVREAGP
ncbi:MAG TPA: hypothetical protein VFD04_04325, partial [Actinomycetes bacterium]|nr:hypothetical protein [Actinomycetes bacterium]